MSKTALLFAGQGAQTVGMGKDLAEAFPKTFERLPDPNKTLGYDLTSICFEGPEDTLTQTENAQPGIFLISWLAYAALRDHLPNLDFHATAGLSLGEFTALAAGGALSFEEGLRLVHRRGHAMQKACEQTQGTMAAIIGLSEANTRDLCQKHGVQIANLNCPGQIVISGEKERVEKACEAAKAQGAKRATPLSVAGAYHSELMAPAAQELEAALRETPFALPMVTVMSNVTGQPHQSVDNIRSLLVEQVTESVLWEQSMRYLIDQGYNRFIELGPGTTLSGFLKRISRDVESYHVADVPSLEETVNALK